MYYNIKIITKDSELALESTDRFIIEREMDLYFVRLFGASEEFKSSIKQIKIQRPKPEVYIKTEPPQIKNNNNQAPNNTNAKPQPRIDNIELINKNFEQIKPVQNNNIDIEVQKDLKENKEQNINNNQEHFEEKKSAEEESQIEQIPSIPKDNFETPSLDITNEAKLENNFVENKEEIPSLDITNEAKQENQQNIDNSLFENQLTTDIKETVSTPPIEKVELEQAAEELFEQLQNEINNQQKKNNSQEEQKPEIKPVIQTEKSIEKQISVEAELENIYKDINKPKEFIQQELNPPELNIIPQEGNINTTDDFAENDKRFNIDDDVEIEFDDTKFKNNESILPTDDKSIISQAKQQLRESLQEDNAQKKSGVLFAYAHNENQEQTPYQDIINVYKERGLYNKEPQISTQPNEEEISLASETPDTKQTQPDIASNVNVQNDTEVKTEPNNEIPNQTFDKYLSMFSVNEIHDEFLVCASYIKNILKQSDFAIKTANASLFQVTGKIADTTIVDELMQKEYIKTIIVDDFTKYTITPNGEAYITGKLSK